MFRIQLETFCRYGIFAAAAPYIFKNGTER